MEKSTEFTIIDGNRIYEKSPQNSIELSLLYCGEKEQLSPLHFEPLNQKAYTLFIFTKGQGMFCTEKKQWQLGEGDSFICFPNEKIQFSKKTQEQCSYIYFAFAGTKANLFVKNAGYTPDNPMRKLQSIDAYKIYLEKILSAHETNLPNIIRRDAYLNCIFAELIKDYKVYSPEASAYDYQISVYVKYTVSYLEDHYHEKTKIGEIAEFIGISRNYLCICFKDEMGISPHEYLTKLRIDKAIELLEATKTSIQTISNMVGYEDSFTFSRAFKKKMGISPREYRDLHYSNVQK